PVRQHAPDLVEIRLEKVGHDHLPSADTLVPTDPLEPAGPRLELRHPHRVLVGHPHRQVPRYDPPQLQIPPTHERLHPLQIPPRITPILILDQPRNGLAQKRPKLLGEASCHGFDVGARQVDGRGGRGAGAGRAPGGGRLARPPPAPPPPPPRPAATANPASKPRRLASTNTPLARIAWR